MDSINKKFQDVMYTKIKNNIEYSETEFQTKM